MIKSSLLLLIFCISIPVSVLAQTEEEDPFKRDPFFTKPIGDFFLKDSSEVMTKEQRDNLQAVKTRRHLRSLNEEGIDFDGGLESGPYFSNPTFSQYPNLPMIHFNRVNGLFLGVKKERMQWHSYNNIFNIPQVRPHGFIGWGTASKTFEYSIGFEKLIGRKNRFMIGAEYHNATTTEDYWRVGLIESSLTSFFSGYDFLDYHKQMGYGIYGAMRTTRWFEAAISYNQDEFSSHINKTRYTMFGYARNHRENPAIDFSSDSLNVERLTIGATFNPRKLIFSKYFTLTGMVSAEFADLNGFDNDRNYRKYEAETKVYYNFEPGSVLKWRTRVGSISGDVPVFKQFYLGGIGSLRGSPYKYFSGNQMVLNTFELQFGNHFSGSRNWINMNDFSTTLFLDSGWTGQNMALINSSNPLKAFNGFSISAMQHDAGIGVGSGLLRFELAWPLKEFDGTPTFWIRLNPTF